MTSRFANSERVFSAHTVPSWLAPLMLAIVAAAAVYGLVELMQRPRTVEAPGFLTPISGEMEIAAYVPPAYPEYAISGARATVIFPDGSERVAQIAPGEDAGVPALPHPEMLGDAQLGTLVRLEFLDPPPATRAPMVEGLPVKLQFDASPLR